MACVFWQDEWETKAEEFMKNIKILKILRRWYWRNVKKKMEIKVEVLSRKFQDWWRISKIDDRVCHGKLRGQHIFRRYDEDVFRTKLIILNSKKNTSLNSLRDVDYFLARPGYSYTVHQQTPWSLALSATGNGATCSLTWSDWWRNKEVGFSIQRVLVSWVSISTAHLLNRSIVH